MDENKLASNPINALANAYYRYIGNPFSQLARGSLKGYFGLGEPENANRLGMEAYRTAEALGNMPGIGAPSGVFKVAAKAVPETAMFIGALARTWSKTSNAKAIELEKVGVDARKIWEETGNWRGPDGQWRQEIPDANAFFRENFNLAQPTKANNYTSFIEGPLGGMYTHRDLYDAYPEMLKTERMEFRKQPDWFSDIQQRGSYRPGLVSVSSKTEDKALSTALHELQHAVQKREGFAQGGSESMFGAGEEAFNQYRRLAGEAEARAVEARRKMTAKERRAKFPEDSYDVPINKLIGNNQK